MSFDWKRVTIEEVTELVTKGTTPTTLGYRFYEEGINFIKVEAITENGRFITQKFMFIDEDTNNALKRSILKEGDVLFTIAGTIGRTALVDYSILPANVNQAVAVVRPKAEIIRSKYLKYVLSNRAFTNSALSRVVQSVQSNFSLGELKSTNILLPNIDMQDKVVSILDSIDNKINLLYSTNQTLESIAQAIFKSWFVDFDPVHARQQGIKCSGIDDATAELFPDSFVEGELGLIPTGWERSEMGKVSRVSIGKTPPRKEKEWFSESKKDVRWLSIRDMGSKTLYFNNSSEYLTREAINRFNVKVVPDNTVLMSFKMTIGRVGITLGEMATNEAIAHFNLDESSPLSSEYIYLWLKLFNFSTLSSTSSIADAVNSQSVRNIPITVPNKIVLEKFQEIIKPIFKSIKNNESKMEVLSEIRDTLLPRLISGKLDLSEIEEQLEGVV